MSTPARAATPAPAPPPTTCPICGTALSPRPQDRPLAPPWLCLRDSRGWEDVELTATARRAFRAEYRDFGDGPAGRFIEDQAVAAARQRTRPVRS